MEEYLEQIINLFMTNQSNQISKTIPFEIRKQLLEIGNAKRLVDELEQRDVLDDELVEQYSLFFTKEEIENSLKDSDSLDSDILSMLLLDSRLEDSLKEKHLGEIQDDYYKAAVIKTFRTDEMKEKHVGEIQDDYDKAAVIETFRTDEMKAKHVGEIQNNSVKADIINTFDDALKEKHLGEIQNNSIKAGIIKTFQNDELKAKHLGEIQSNDWKESIINTFQDDELKAKHLGEIQDDYYKVNVINTFQDDALKAKHLGEIQNDSYKAQVIVTFQDDALKEKYLGEIQNDSYKAQVIVTFQDDALKEKYLGEIQDDGNKAAIIKTFQDDTLKEKYLGEIQDERYKAQVIVTFQDNALKEKYLGEIQDDGNKAQVIVTFQDDALKEKYLGEIQDDGNKAAIIKTFQDDTLKERYLEEIQDDRYKVEVIETIQDDTLKEKCLGKIEIDSIKILILKLMKDKLTIIQTINSHDFSTSMLLNYLQHLEHVEKDEILSGVSDHVIEKYIGDDFTKKEHWKKLSNMFSPQAVLYLKNETIQEICSWDDQSFDKLTHLLVCDKMDISTINDIVSSLRQKDFTLNKPNVTQVFSNLKNAMLHDDDQQIQTIVSQIGTQVNFRRLFENDNFITYSKKYGYTREDMIVHFDQFLMKLCTESKMESLEEREKIYQCLHDITNNYIEYARNRYVGDFMDNYIENLKIPKVPNKNKLLDHVLKVESVQDIVDLLKQVDLNKINENGRILLADQKLLEGCIQFKKNPLLETDITVKKQLKTFND